MKFNISDIMKSFAAKKWECAHHLLMAAVIASCTLLLENVGYLNWLDAISLRLATSINNGPAQKSASKQDSTSKTPVTILIDDVLYEDYFDQSSPLDRGKLASLIAPILAKNPMLLAIDLDLSPGANDRKGDSAGQQSLDHLLDDAAHNGCASSEEHSVTHGCKIVLAMPLPVVSESLEKLQFDWVKARCSAGIQFAETELLSHQGTVIKHSTTAPSLGNVSAWWLAGRHNQSVEVAGHEVENHKNHDVICKVAAKSFDAIEFFGEMKHGLGSSTDTKISPLNTKYFAEAGDTIKPAKLVPGSVVEIPAVSDRTVFLGGSYGKADKFVTTTGERDGVAIHAATFFSAAHGVGTLPHWIAWLLDILVGLFLGWIFSCMWGQYNTANNKLHNGKSTLASWKMFKAFLHAKFWLFLNLVLLIAGILESLNIAGWLLSYDLWLNPGPIMIGMFIDTLLASRSEKEPHDATFSLLLKEHPDMVWQIPFVVVFILWIPFFSHQ